jgi:hypothetical protein
MFLDNLVYSILGMIFFLPTLLLFYWLVLRARGLRPMKEVRPGPAPAGEQRLAPWVAWDAQRLLVSESGVGFASMEWSALASITVKVVRARIFGDPLYWHFNGRQQCLRIAESADGVQALLDHIAGLPGFDAGAAAAARERREDGEVTVWARAE